MTQADKKSENKNSGWFKSQLTKQRWLFLVFGNDGLEARRIVYCQASGELKEKGVVRFLRISESSLSNSQIFKIFAAICFFPFPYKIMVVSSRKYCRSKYFAFQMDRNNFSKPVDSNELSTAFSKNLWPTLEANKKEFMRQSGYEDLDVLLVQSQVVNISMDEKNLKNLDDIFSVAGKKVSIGVVQTFLYRGFFSALKKIFPKRAIFREFHEYGFNLPLSVFIYTKDKLERKLKKFIIATVEEKETKIFLFDGKTLSYKDSFSFGRRSLYEALHHTMNVDISVFNELIKKIVTDDMSNLIKKKIVSVLDKELARLGNGLAAFKKETRSQAFFVDGQGLNPFLRLHSRYSSWIFDNSLCNCRCKADVSKFVFNDSLKADILCSLGLDKKDQVNAIATRQIRWLIPHAVDVK